jgi:hypothetical protein
MITSYISEELKWAAVTIPSVVRVHPSDPDQFDRFIESPLVTKYPCHQQAVERAVALMTESKLKCANKDMKAGHHIVVSEERQQNPGKQRKFKKLMK